MSGAVVFLLATTVILSAAGIALSFFALWRSQCMFVSMGANHRTATGENEASLSALRSTVEELTAQVRDLQHQPGSGSGSSPAPRASLNLSKRSQALRMHRQGELPDRIAAALEIPRQEVELLMKVHRIVIAAVPTS